MSRNHSERPGVEPINQTDPQLEQEIADALGDQSVEELLEGSIVEQEAAAQAEQAQRAEQNGDGDQKPAGGGTRSGDEQFEHPIRRGRISAIEGDDVFVDLTGSDSKHQGIVPLTQFERPPRVGSIMDFVVERIDESQGLTHLSREGAVSQATWDQLHKGSVVEARVTGSNKGGLELELAGSIRAFMPASQVDLHHIDDLSIFVGEKIQAMVHEIDRRRRRVLLSRRAHLQRERERAEKKIWAEIKVGDEREGTVRNVMAFGAFVDIGGVDGLVHVSDLSYSHVDKPSDVVKNGDKVTVKVLKLDPETKRISLGIKQAKPNPWVSIGERLKPGEQVAARVVRVTNFGAFVEIEPGIEGLAPASELSWKRIGNPGQVVEENQVLHFVVLEIQPEKERLTLSLKQAQGDPWIGIEHHFPPNTVVEGKVVRTTDFGAFVELKPGIEGLVHISELSNQHVDTVETVVKNGETHKFRILETDEQEHRIRLSLKRVDEPLTDQQQAAANKTQQAAPIQREKPKNLKGGMGKGGGMGIGLGDLKLPG